MNEEEQKAIKQEPAAQVVLDWLRAIIQDIEAAYTSSSQLGRGAALNRALSTLSSSPPQLTTLSATAQLVVKQLIDRYSEVVTREAGHAGQIEILEPVASPYMFTRPVAGSRFIGRNELFDEIQRLWSAEAIRRRDEIRSGQVQPVPGEEVLGEVRRLVGR